MRFIACLLLGVILCPVIRAYDLITDPGSIYVVAWQPGSIPMQVKLATSPTLTDGTNFNSSVQAAMQAWNAVIGTVQFVPQTSSPGAYSNGNQISEIVMDSTVDGEAFGGNALAVTISYSEGDTQVESDIVFNNAYTWNSYPGTLQQNPVDLRRVAIHELGHVLGLGHPDQAGQSVTAIMNSTVSNVATLQSDDIAGARVLYGAPGFVPANNNFANAVTTSSANTQFTGTNVGANRESGEPAHGGEPVGHSVWWRWTAPGSGATTITTLGSNFDTILAVYTGSAVNALTLVAENDDEEPPIPGSPNPARKRSSKVEFNAVGGTIYAIAVDGWDGNAASITLNLNFTGPITSTPSFQSHPSSKTVTAGQSVQLSASASGNPAPTLQWQRLPAGSGTWGDLSNGGGYSGATSGTLNISTNLSMNGDQFRLVATNIAGSATSNPALLTVNPVPIAPTITLQPVSRAFVSGGTVTFTVNAAGTGTLHYQWQRNGSNLASGGRITGATTNSLTIVDEQASDVGGYTVVVSNSAGEVTSNVAYLSLPTALAVAAGDRYGVILRTGGRLWTGGRNYAGQLGDGTTIDRPDQVVLADEVAAADVGDNHALYIKSDGTLWGVGGNYAGQLGDGTKINRSIARQIATDVVAASAGGGSSAYLTKDGSLWVFGTNYGDARDGTLIDRVTPFMLTRGVAAVSVGGEHMLFIKPDRTLWAIGRNWYGQFGNGTSQNKYLVPQLVASDVVAACAGSGTTLFLKSDGTLWGAGANTYGQLGDGTSTNRTSFGQIAANVVDMSAGATGVLFIKSDNSLWIASNGPRATGEVQPLPVQLTTNVVVVTGGILNYLYLKPDGAVVAGGDFNGVNMSSPGGDLVPPAAPTGLAAAFDASARMVRLSWNLTINAMKYEVWRNTANFAGTATRIASNVPIALFYDTSAIPGVPYYYWIKAVNLAGASAFTPSSLGQIPGTNATDFNHDGHTDVLWRNSATNQVGLWLMDGTTSLGFFYVANESGDWKIFGTGDFNADGQSDFLWRNTATMQIGVWLMDGTASTGFVHLAQESADWKIFGTGDFNADGHSDLLWRNTATMQVGVRLMDGTDAIGFVYLAQESGDWKIFGTGDFNADGQSDILWRNTATMQVGVWLMDGTANTGFVYLANESGEWKIFGTGDFNADGQTDILWRNSVTDQVGVWLMDGLTSTGFVYLANESGEWKIINN